jgi:hypothetical protein
MGVSAINVTGTAGWDAILDNRVIDFIVCAHRIAVLVCFVPDFSGYTF